MKQSNLQTFCLTCIFIALLSLSCNKDKGQRIPYVNFNFNINILSDPEFMMLQAQGNSQYIDKYPFGAVTSLGYNNNGIIIYNEGNGSFTAFDCTCPFDFPEKNAVVFSQSNDGITKCPVCNSIYVLPSSGIPTVAGPSTYPLEEYKTYYDPTTGNLNVFN